MATSFPSGGPAPLADSSGAALRAVDHAAVTSRRGGIVMITGPDGEATLVMAAEGATKDGLARLARLGDGGAKLILTASRAAAPGLLAVSGPVIPFSGFGVPTWCAYIIRVS